MDIEDAISNAIVKGFESVKGLRKPEYFKTWLIRILINECNLIIRKNRKVITLDNKDDGIEDSYKDLDLIRAIDSLESDLREVIILCYFQDMTGEEIGRVLNLNHNTVRTRLHRGKKKLYEILIKE